MLTTIYEGNYFGEMAVLDESSALRLASVQSTGKCVCIVVSKSAIVQACSDASFKAIIFGE